MTSHGASFPPPCAGEVAVACGARDRRRGRLDAAKLAMRNLVTPEKVYNNQDGSILQAKSSSSVLSRRFWLRLSAKAATKRLPREFERTRWPQTSRPMIPPRI